MTIKNLMSVFAPVAAAALMTLTMGFGSASNVEAHGYGHDRELSSYEINQRNRMIRQKRAHHQLHHRRAEQQHHYGYQKRPRKHYRSHNGYNNRHRGHNHNRGSVYSYGNRGHVYDNHRYGSNDSSTRALGLSLEIFGRILQHNHR